MSIKRRLLAGMVVAASVLAACGDDDKPSSEPTAAPDTSAVVDSTHDHTDSTEMTTEASPKVVATTSWVAAFAQMAGATDITVIAPSNLQHPPDYDPKASDLAAVADADFILLAGFEGFADRLKEAAGSEAVVDVVATEFFPEALEHEVLRLAALMGFDEHEAQHNIEHYKEHWAEESARVQEALTGKSPVVVSHAFTGVWAALAGLEVAGSFGPQPLSPADVAALVDLHPTVILENKHMPGGAGLADASGAVQLDMTNFPGDDLDLQAVVTINADVLIEGIK